MPNVKKIKAVSLLSLLVGMVIFIGTCKFKEIQDPLTASQFKVADNSALFSYNGLNKRTFYRYETIFLTFKDLYPNEQTDIQIIRLPEMEVIKRLLVITDGNGLVKDLPIWYYIGHRLPGRVDDESGDYAVHILQPGINRPWKIYSIPFFIVNEISPDTHLSITDGYGRFVAGSRLLGQPVWVTGRGLPANSDVRLLVVPDKNDYQIGEMFSDVSDDGIETVKTSNGGILPVSRIWTNPSIPGGYDVAADTPPYGEYNAGDVICYRLLIGLTIQEPSMPADIIEDIACDEFGHYRDVFDSLETVFARVSARRRPLIESEFIGIYVTLHKDEWMEGDSLVCLRTVGTMEMPTHCLWNGTAGSLGVVRTHGESLPDDPNPIKMWPGKYDVIIDVDRNMLYDPGIDILDGGPREAFQVFGKRPPIRFGANADLDFIGVYYNRTKIWGVLVDSLDNFISDIPIRYKVVSGPGRVYPDTSITDQDGQAASMFTGANYGKGTTVQLYAIVEGDLYTRSLLIFRKIPYTHNQGIIIGE